VSSESHNSLTLAIRQEKDHVARMARFALQCVAAASETLVDEEDPSGGFVVIRAGFHSGPVIANVVGTKYR
jgi:class 3 adenylate cyclase